jgi:hypothetical protein
MKLAVLVVNISQISQPQGQPEILTPIMAIVDFGLIGNRKDGAASVIRTRDLTLTKGEVEGYRYLKINIIFESDSLVCQVCVNLCDNLLERN